MVELHLITVFNLQSLLKVGREYILLSSATPPTMGIPENYFKQTVADFYRRVEGNGEGSLDILLGNSELASFFLLEVCLWELQ